MVRTVFHPPASHLDAAIIVRAWSAFPATVVNAAMRDSMRTEFALKVAKPFGLEDVGQRLGYTLAVTAAAYPLHALPMTHHADRCRL